MVGIWKASKRVRDASGVTFQPRDFRRSATSHMAAMGFLRLIVSRILAHADQSVTGKHYDRYEYAIEKREALNAWGKRVDKIISGTPTGAEVVRLQPGAR